MKLELRFRASTTGEPPVPSFSRSAAPGAARASSAAVTARLAAGLVAALVLAFGLLAAGACTGRSEEVAGSGTPGRDAGEPFDAGKPDASGPALACGALQGEAPGITTATIAPSGVIVADFNADGNADVAAVGSDVAASSLRSATGTGPSTPRSSGPPRLAACTTRRPPPASSPGTLTVTATSTSPPRTRA